MPKITLCQQKEAPGSRILIQRVQHGMNTKYPPLFHSDEVLFNAKLISHNHFYLKKTMSTEEEQGDYPLNKQLIVRSGCQELEDLLSLPEGT